jgi:serine/threonine-protein kinase
MSAVFAARDERLGRQVALKLLLPNLASSREAVLRFVNEARSLARIQSRHVIAVHDCGVIKEASDQVPLPFMVLELLNGADLWAYERGEGPLDVARIVDFGLQICEGLAAAHAEGIVHRDLKPENLFVTIEPDGSETIKVLDFGVARASEAQRSLTTNKDGLGSPGYMSPEQLRDSHDVDARGDIWSLGVVLHELLANQPLFDGETPYELCAQVLNCEIPPLAKLRPGLPAGLVRAVERCLARDREERFQDVAELAESLAPFADPSTASDVARIRRRLDRAAPCEPVWLRSNKPALVMVSEPPLPDNVVSFPPPANHGGLSERRRELRPRSARRTRRRSVTAVALAALALVPAGIALAAFVSGENLLPAATAWSSRIASAAEGVSARITEVAQTVTAPRGEH